MGSVQDNPFELERKTIPDFSYELAKFCLAIQR